jgi:hypothetical protein
LETFSFSLIGKPKTADAVVWLSRVKPYQDETCQDKTQDKKTTEAPISLDLESAAWITA